MRPITIVGGGLAGLTLGILLRQRGVPVELFEAGKYPRHRVCGEFISGRGGDLLTSLGVTRDLPVVECRTARFFANGRAGSLIKLPEPGRCISRRALDHRLAEAFEGLGGVLHAGTRWTGDFEDPGVVRASGRRLGSGRRSLYSGLKIHATNLRLSAGLELHFSRSGYVGICQLAGGTVNVCGLFREGADLAGARNAPARVFETVASNRLAEDQVLPESFCSVAGVSIGPGADEERSSREFRLGDSLAVIAPLTGNGMSLAIESAFLALPAVGAYAREDASWDRVRVEFSQTCKKAFTRRLRVSSFLQKLLLGKMGRGFLLSCLETAPAGMRILHSLTR